MAREDIVEQTTRSLCIRHKNKHEYVLLDLTFEKDLLMISKVIAVFPSNQAAKEHASTLIDAGEYESIFYANGRERIVK